MLLTLKSPRKDEIKDGTHAHIGSLSVLPAYRGQGVARRLITQSLQSCRRIFNVSEVTLNIRGSDTPAVALYTSLGFCKVMERAGHYYDGKGAFAMNLMLGDGVLTST
ncbi:hypothetical protein BDN67DRAFT_83209 [Paxillus ammoniavirescens]|nr:hypothetical protein BDN67DRAFT_83209 [Paxillus ammoniavirescens]